MSKKFTLNGKKYDAIDFDFGTVLDLEDVGIEMDFINNKPTKFLCGYIAVCTGMTLKEASKEVNAHVLNGGKLDSLADMMREKLEASDFFRKLLETQETVEETNQ